MNKIIISILILCILSGCVIRQTDYRSRIHVSGVVVETGGGFLTKHTKIKDESGYIAMVRGIHGSIGDSVMVYALTVK